MAVFGKWDQNAEDPTVRFPDFKKELRTDEYEVSRNFVMRLHGACS